MEKTLVNISENDTEEKNMKFLDKWMVKHINWIKPLESLELHELFKLQNDLDRAIAKKLETKK